jgi:hypothetical protein
MPAAPAPPSPEWIVERRRGRWKLYLIVLICAAPVLASYYTYYFVRPEARSNYGELIEPQRPLPPLTLKHLDGRPFDVGLLKGKWLMLMVDGGACPESCAEKLYHMRQVRLTTGKERERVETVWLVPDQEPLSTVVMRAYDGTIMLRADPEELRAWLPTETGGSITEHIFIVDPLGNLMLRFPKHADPSRTKKDLAKLLAASSIG